MQQKVAGVIMEISVKYFNALKYNNQNCTFNSLSDERTSLTFFEHAYNIT